MQLAAPVLRPTRYIMQGKNTDLIDLKCYLEFGVLPQNNQIARKVLMLNNMFYTGENALLYHLNHVRRNGPGGPRSQLDIPANLRYEILISCHDDVTAEHLGVHTPYEKIRTRYGGKECSKTVNLVKILY